VAAVLGSLAEERGITMQAHTPQPVSVLGDEPRLIQAIMNLLDNALTYTDHGGLITLEVTARGAEARVTVQDTGIGIAPEHLPHIFERFYRADPARTRVRGGTGLGLSIVDWVVRAHGGRIEVSSELRHGTTFVVMLPPNSNPVVASQTATPVNRLLSGA
jgi:signal transduction histidine kinase